MNFKETTAAAAYPREFPRGRRAGRRLSSDSIDSREGRICLAAFLFLIFMYIKMIKMCQHVSTRFDTFTTHVVLHSTKHVYCVVWVLKCYWLHIKLKMLLCCRALVLVYDRLCY